MNKSPENWTKRQAWIFTFTFSGPLLFTVGGLYRHYRAGAFTASDWLLFLLWASPVCVLIVHCVARHLSPLAPYPPEQEMTKSGILTLFRWANLTLFVFTIIAIVSLVVPVPAAIHAPAIVFGALTSLFIIIASIWQYFIRHERVSLARAIIASIPLVMFISMFVSVIARTAS